MNIANKIVDEIIQESLMDKVKDFGRKVTPRKMPVGENINSELSTIKKNCSKLKEKNRQDYDYCILKKLKIAIEIYQMGNVNNNDYMNKLINGLLKIYNERRAAYIKKYQK